MGSTRCSVTAAATRQLGAVTGACLTQSDTCWREYKGGALGLRVYRVAGIAFWENCAAQASGCAAQRSGRH